MLRALGAAYLPDFAERQTDELKGVIMDRAEMTIKLSELRDRQKALNAEQKNIKDEAKSSLAELFVGKTFVKKDPKTLKDISYAKITGFDDYNNLMLFIIEISNSGMTIRERKDKNNYFWASTAWQEISADEFNAYADSIINKVAAMKGQKP